MWLVLLLMLLWWRLVVVVVVVMGVYDRWWCASICVGLWQMESRKIRNQVERIKIRSTADELHSAPSWKTIRCGVIAYFAKCLLDVCKVITIFIDSYLCLNVKFNSLIWNIKHFGPNNMSNIAIFSLIKWILDITQSGQPGLLRLYH